LYWPKNRKTKWIGQQNPVKILVKSHSQLLQATAAIVVYLPAEKANRYLGKKWRMP